MIQDLSLFCNVNFENIRNSIISKYHKLSSVSICHYVVKSNKVYRTCHGQHVGFKIFMDATLLSLAMKVALPDVDFFMNLGGWPLVLKNSDPVHPIFSWCGSTNSWDVVLPTYDITEFSLSDSHIDPSKTIFWGPGLKPQKIVLRARYIFVQLRDKAGKNCTLSPGSGVVSAQIRGRTEHDSQCSIWTQILDSNDGSFIIRYNLRNSCTDLQVVVKVKNVVVVSVDSKGLVHEEECYCPNPEIKSWLAENECPRNYSQMIQDLSPFRNVNFENIRNSIISKYHKPSSVSICHYVVKSNKVYRTCYGQHVGFKIFMDATLLSLARKVALPDVEFFMNLGDWPLVLKNSDAVHPIFSWCGSTNSWDVVLPTYDITESSLESMGRVTLDMLSVQSNVKIAWENKTEKLFWRGRDSRRERLDLINIARKYPDLINASITNFFFFQDEIDKYGPGQSHVSFFHFFKYKYQLNVDGTVAAYRFPYLIAGDSLVLKQDSQYYEFFYNNLVPGEHYVPVKSDLSNLVEKIHWGKEHDEEAYKISRSARQFARDNLLPRDILCYHVVLLQEWNKRLRNPIKVLPSMEHVPQPQHECQCENDEDEDEAERDEL